MKQYLGVDVLRARTRACYYIGKLPEPGVAAQPPLFPISRLKPGWQRPSLVSQSPFRARSGHLAPARAWKSCSVRPFPSSRLSPDDNPPRASCREIDRSIDIILRAEQRRAANCFLAISRNDRTRNRFPSRLLRVVSICSSASR